MDAEEQQQLPGLSPMHYRIMCGLLLLWWIAFLYPVFSMGDVDSGLVDAEAATNQGNLFNQVVIISFAGMGLFHMRRALSVLQHKGAMTIAAFAGLYCLWSATSLLWTEDANLTVRRLLSFILLLIGSFGIGAGFYAYTREGVKTLARHVVAGAVLCVVMLIGLRLADQSLAELLDPEFSLKGSTRISYYAFPVGYAITALLALWQGQPVKQVGTTALLFLVMIVLKGRTMVADALATALLVASRITDISLLRAALLTVGTALTAVLADLVTGGSIFINVLIDGYDKISNWIPWLTLGEGLRNITSLSGRLPLWEMVYPYIQNRPWLGHGFGAFWNPTRFNEAYRAAGWRAVTSHNGFLDELLATGVIGLGLFLAFWGAGMISAYRCGQRTKSPFAFMVCGWMLLYLLFNSLESIFQMFFQLPTFLSLIAIFTLLHQDTAPSAEIAGDVQEVAYASFEDEYQEVLQSR